MTELVYPIPAPAAGDMVDVAPGVRWIRLPMPYRLDHINVWALDDGAGWALVDTGMRTEATADAWAKLMPRLPGELTRVLVTHMHPDHVGMAGWLTRTHGVGLWMSRLEYLTCRVLTSDTSREAPADALTFYQQAGWSRAPLEGYRARFGNFGKHIHALPDSYHRLEDGQYVRIGAHDWEVVTGNGHSPEHASLYCAPLKLFISGDQILPRISSNVSVTPMEPEADPMADWLASLAKVRARVPDDVLVLPAHNDCFRGLHARVAKLEQDAYTALDRLQQLLAEPRRVIDCFGALFSRPISESDAAHLGMATGEAVASLNYLLHRGKAVREVRDGIAWYRAKG